MNLGELFRESARQHANGYALAFSPVKKITYAELDLFSNQAASYLLEQGFRKGDRLGLCLEKSASFYILVLAALKIGAPYFALDPRNPGARLAGMIRQCNPRIIFSHLPLSEYVEPVINHLCPENAELPEFCKKNSKPVFFELPELNGSDLAYIMFTSGSTGKPKGAMMSYDNLFNFIRWAGSQHGFVSGEVHTHLNPVYFDNSVFDIYSTLFTGGELVPFVHEMMLAPQALAERLCEMKCTVWFSVPSLLIYLQIMKVVTGDTFGGLRKVFFGGEGFPKVKLKALMDVLGDHVEYHNVSGPTECTCICSSYRVTRADIENLEGLPPIGSLISSFKGYILDGDRPVERGEVGELCLAGPCVGLGYYDQPELTKQVFVQNPLNTSQREVLYRTGDLVREDPKDGKLYFTGRRDLQVKHMGYRIELEEIQHALDLCDLVDESAVLYRQARDQGELIAVIASGGVSDAESLKMQLARRLPKYMIPSKFHFLDRLPKNANGKTDRQALVMKYGK